MENSQEIFFVQPDWQLFTNINTLPQQAGVAHYLLPKLVCKELTDNALDADGQVEISSEVDDAFNTTITIRNHGKSFPGSDEEIADLFSIRRPLTSSKRLRLPSRGALGNGLRVVTATVYCLQGVLTIASNGRKIQLIPQDDGTTQPKVLETFEEEGTEVKISFPDNLFSATALEWAELALDVNQGETYNGKTNPYWYDSDSFYNLCLSTPKNISTKDFVLLFEDCNLKRAKQVADRLRLVFINQTTREQADEILELLRSFTKPALPKQIGGVGEIPKFEAVAKVGHVFSVAPQKGKFAGEIPAVVEAYGSLNQNTKFQVFVNKTPIPSEVGLTYLNKKISVFGCGLSFEIETPKFDHYPTFWVSIITPYMPIVSNGKEPDLSLLQEPIQEALKKVILQLKKNQQQLSIQKVILPTEKLLSQKEVVLDHLAIAITKVSGNGQYRYSLRQLYYVLRPIVMEQTGKELKYANFNGIVTDYEFDTGKDLNGVYRDERGTLLHPHTYEEVRLGTKSIEKYRRPTYNFNKILYSEKEGFFEILKEAGFCEKYDLALLTSKGFASRAARDVIDLLSETEEELTFFCIHDADISGTLIYQALQGATKARPERKVKIINLGIEPWEAMQMQLEVENLEKKSLKNPAGYVDTFDQREDAVKPIDLNDQLYQSTWSEWLKSYRVELNAMDTPTFINWLSHKISQHDQGKVIPNSNYLHKEAETKAESNLKNRIRTQILEKMDIEKLVLEKFEEVFPQLKSRIQNIPLEEMLKNDLDNNPQQSWAKAFQDILWRQMKNLE